MILTHKNSFLPTPLMPVLFVGHGNPMNAIEQNEFTQTWKHLGESIPRPQTILCISAHWETRGTCLTAMASPKTIHDFGGFPEQLNQVIYAAPGNPDLANDIKMHIQQPEIKLDFTDWGFDHGAWSVIKHIYPKANIPLIQMSIDCFQKPEYHYQLAKELLYLRSRGVLIIGSGNIVHNLREVNWSDVNAKYAWAIEAQEKVNQAILDGNHQLLLDYKKQGSALQLAIPSSEHFIPLIYALGLQCKTDKVSLFNEKILMGSLSMNGVMINT